MDLRDLDPEWLRRQIGFVPQETFLFSATLAENIALGVEGATEQDIARAAELAGLGPDIAGFPAGYQTMIGERGLTLSGGQKQRVAIARADLARSADPDSGRRAFQRRHADRRAHSDQPGRRDARPHHHPDLAPRLHGPERHRIFVIEHGEVAEQGTHAQLIASGGYYADLYQKQLLEEELEAI